jgi:hypothetical protein
MTFLFDIEQAMMPGIKMKGGKTLQTQVLA